MLADILEFIIDIMMDILGYREKEEISLHTQHSTLHT